MGNTSAKETERKLEVLRRVTGGKPFVVRDLPDGIYDQLDYGSKNSLSTFLCRLADGTSRCGRQLIKIRDGEYVWVNSSNGGVELETETASLLHVARYLSSNEVAALDLAQGVLVKSQDGSIRLTSKMVAMDDEDEFLDFMDKLESVKAAVKIGTNGRSVGGHVWGLVRDNFSDFYQVAQAVRSGQYEFPPSEPEETLLEEPPTPVSVTPLPTANQKPVKKLSATGKKLAALCQLLEEEIAEYAQDIKQLEAQIAEKRNARVETVRRFNLFQEELQKIKNQ